MAINFPIVTTFDDKAVKKADDAFKKLGKTFIGVFSVAKVVSFAKSSVAAFAQAEKEAALLANQLESINLGFASPYLNDFIDKLALATGKTGGELTNAFVALSQATGDATTAQKILSTALDVSLGTGKDLQSVAVALQRAYKGETTALARLRIGYTTAELKGKDFADILDELQGRFEGSAARATETFAAKMARLSEAVDQAKEGFGKGFVQGLEESSIKVEDLQEDIITLGTVLGQTAAASVSFADKMINQLDRIGKSGAAQRLMQLFEGFTRYVIGGIVFGDPGQSFSAGTSARIGTAARASEKAASAALRAQNALSKAEAKSAAAKLAATKKQAAADKKKQQENAILNDLQKRFDLERIQIQAALGGQINEVERLRLELMQAILDQDVKRAIILEGQLIKAEAAAAELANLLDSLDEMVGDPFADWPATIAKIQGLLKTLNIKIPIETLFAEKGLKLDQKNMTVTTLERMDVDAKYVYINGEMFDWTKKADDSGLKPGTLAHAEATLALAMAVSNDADATLAESEAALAAAEAAAAAADAANAMNEFYLAQLFASLGLDANGNPITNTTVNVNVEGTVIGENDLVEMITDNIYRIQKTGKQILLSTLEI